MARWPHKKLGHQEIGGRVVNVLGWASGEDTAGNLVPLPVFEELEKPAVRFPLPEDVGPREWGTEMLLLLAPQKYTLKLITMKAGAKGGLQYHRLKDEGGIMMKGSMRVRYDDGAGTLVERLCRRGDVFHFPAGAVHQSEAVTACSYIEVSTPHFNDRVHVEGKYGIEEEAGGLPSTEPWQVELR
jgi:quercetin dioxygenase-like cupin family protein